MAMVGPRDAAEPFDSDVSQAQEAVAGTAPDERPVGRVPPDVGTASDRSDVGNAGTRALADPDDIVPPLPRDTAGCREVPRPPAEPGVRALEEPPGLEEIMVLDHRNPVFYSCTCVFPSTTLPSAFGYFM